MAKILVELTRKVATFGYNGQVYKPGDVFEVDDQFFREDFMRKVTRAEAKAKAVDEPIAVASEEGELAPSTEEAPKETTRKKK